MSAGTAAEQLRRNLAAYTQLNQLQWDGCGWYQEQVGQNEEARSIRPSDVKQRTNSADLTANYKAMANQSPEAQAFYQAYRNKEHDYQRKTKPTKPAETQKKTETSKKKHAGRSTAQAAFPIT